MTETVVWVPGWSVGPFIFAESWAALPGYRHIGCDLTRVSDPAKFVAHVADCVLAAPGPVHLVGWSMGAMLAAEVAIATPGVVDTLALIGATSAFVRRGPATGASHGSAGLAPAVLDAMRTALPRRPGTVVHAFWRSMFTEDERAAGFDRTWREHCDGALPPLECLEAGLAYLADFSIEPGAISAPTSLLHGGLDTICPRVAAERMALEIPAGSLTVLESTGHAPFLTRAEEFHRWMIDVLRR